MNLVYTHEPPLFVISMTLGVLFWLGFVLGTVGAALLYVLIPRLNAATIVIGAIAYEDGSIGWDCAGGTLEPNYRAPNCRPAP